MKTSKDSIRPIKSWDLKALKKDKNETQNDYAILNIKIAGLLPENIRPLRARRTSWLKQKKEKIE